DRRQLSGPRRQSGIADCRLFESRLQDPQGRYWIKVKDSLEGNGGGRLVIRVVFDESHQPRHVRMFKVRSETLQSELPEFALTLYLAFSRLPHCLRRFVVR